MPHSSHATPILVLVLACLATAESGCIALPSEDATGEAPLLDGGAIWPLRTPAEHTDASAGQATASEANHADCAAPAPPPAAPAAAPETGGPEDATAGAMMASEDATGEPGDAGPGPMDAATPSMDAGDADPAQGGAGGSSPAPAAAGDGPDAAHDAAAAPADGGATGSLSTPETEPALPAPTLPGDVVITEIMADPAERPDTDGEWIELLNPGTRTLDLSACTLGEGEPSDAEIGPLSLPGGAYATIARNEQPGFAPDAIVALSLRNTSDAVVVTCAQVEIDRVEYDSAGGFRLTAGASMSLSPARLNAMENDAADAWCSATSPYGADLGTPGAANDTCGE